MKVVNNYIKNVNKIIELAKQQDDQFLPRTGDKEHASILGLTSQFKTLFGDNMSQKLLDTIFENFDEELSLTYEFVQIQKYDIGDFIVPHQDKYDIIKLYLCVLTSSSVDGICIQNGDKIEKILDCAGTFIDADMTAIHWVDPILDHTRYSLVIGE